MKSTEQTRFDTQYKRHLRALKLQGLSDSTIDVYARAVRRVAERYDCCPDQLTTEQLEAHFSALVASHYWSTVKVDRNGLQFFWKHVLERDWSWLDIVKAPKIQSLPDILTLTEVEQLIGATHQLRYRVFLLAMYSMGLRLGETLALEVGDIDSQRKQVHIRRGKGHKDRLVPLPDLTHRALHTHSRRLDHHPHVHVIVPGGGVDQVRRQWKKTKGQYLFNAFALAKVFRARLLAAINAAGLRLPDHLPEQWVVDCQSVGKGEPALAYLSRYLYRGVISEKNILPHRDGKVTFRYTESKTGATRTRTLKGEDFLWLVLQHVLPRGFRQVRDYGFLHGNAKRLLSLVQLVLRVVIEARAPRPVFKCPCCQSPMQILGFVRPAWSSG